MVFEIVDYLDCSVISNGLKKPCHKRMSASLNPRFVLFPQKLAKDKYYLAESQETQGFVSLKYQLLW